MSSSSFFLLFSLFFSQEHSPSLVLQDNNSSGKHFTYHPPLMGDGYSVSDSTSSATCLCHLCVWFLQQVVLEPSFICHVRSGIKRGSHSRILLSCARGRRHRHPYICHQPAASCLSSAIWMDVAKLGGTRGAVFLSKCLLSLGIGGDQGRMLRHLTGTNKQGWLMKTHQLGCRRASDGVCVWQRGHGASVNLHQNKQSRARTHACTRRHTQNTHVAFKCTVPKSKHMYAYLDTDMHGHTHRESVRETERANVFTQKIFYYISHWSQGLTFQIKMEKNAQNHSNVL